MHRFYLPNPPSQNQLVLSGREAHHAANVLRLRRGEIVKVLDGAGTEFECEVQDVSKKNVNLIIRKQQFTPAPSSSITLLQAVPKGKLLETIIQKATELGANHIVPILSERVVTHLDNESAEEKREKWQQVAIEAIKQCGQPWLPNVELPVTPEQFLKKNEGFDLPLIASLQPGSCHPRNHFSNYLASHSKRPQSVGVWIGPEGDFSPAEVAQITAAGVLPITLGPLVLRCETAAIYCLSVINYELQSAAVNR